MPPAKTPNEPVEPLHEVLKSLVALQEHAAASQEQMRESSEALIEANRSTLELLTQRLIDATERSARELSEAMIASRPEQLVVQSAEDATTKEQRLEQQQLVLTYNAFRTMLGRAPTSLSRGAAVVFMADRVDDRGQHDSDGDSILILSPAPFAVVKDGWKLVAITTRGEPLTESLRRHVIPVRVRVQDLAPDLDIARLEIRGPDDNPLFLGLGPATHTQNAKRHKGRHAPGEAIESAEAGMADEDPDRAPPAPYEESNAPTREFDRGIR
jgi:hypothetical protein